MSTFEVTAYCGGSCCNGKWAGQTASGRTPCEGRTCAAVNILLELEYNWME